MEIEESLVHKLADERSLVTKTDFVKLGQDMKLLDFGGGLGEKRKPQSPRMEKRKTERKEEEKVGILKLYIICLFVFQASNQSLLDVLLSSGHHDQDQPGGGQCGQGDEGLPDLGH